MKKLKMVIVALVVSASANAQEDTLKGQQGDWGFGINISGLINNIQLENNKDGNGNYTIFARKYLKNDAALRLTLNVNSDRLKATAEDSITNGAGNRALQQVDSSVTRFDFSVGIGYEKHLAGTRRLDPYFAGELTIGRIGGTKTDVNTEVTDVTGADKTQQIIQRDGGLNFSLGAIAGFNYFVAAKLSLGAEFGLGYTYSKVGGDWSESVVNTPANGSQTSTFELGKDANATSAIGVNSSGRIILSYFF